MSSLFVILGSGQGLRHQILKRVVSIGRDISNVIHLQDAEASRHHAEIRQQDGVDWVYDLGSANGVFVNGKRINEAILENGDQIQIGKTLFLYSRRSEKRVIQDQSSVPSVDFQQDEFPKDPARIIHSVKQEEGSRLFDSLGKTPEFSWLSKAKSHLQMMYHTTLVVSQTLDIDRLLDRIMELIFEWVLVDRGCIMLFDHHRGNLVPRVTKTRQLAYDAERMTISRRILDYVLTNREGVLTSDAQKDERWEPGGSVIRLGICEAICVPMQGRYGVVGVIYIDTTTTLQEAMTIKPNETKYLTSDHLKLMIAIAHQAALAVEDTRYYLGMLQAERLAAIGQTVAVLSHHIKNILQGIRGGNYLIEKGLADTDFDLLTKGWRIVEKNQNKISDLVLDMLTFSKEREPNLASDDINQVLDDVIELMQGHARELEIQLNWYPDKVIPMFYFDAEQIHRAVTNIVTNGLDAVRQCLTQHENTAAETQHPVDQKSFGLVEVRTLFVNREQTEAAGTHAYQLRSKGDSNSQLPKGQWVRIIIDDNGMGIPLEKHDTLFQPFLSNKRGNTGTGLGLAVTHKIIEEHNGQIRIETSHLGGARFVLEIPLRLTSGT